MLWQGLSFKKCERPVPRKGVKEGRREEEEGEQRDREARREKIKERGSERVGLNIFDAKHSPTPNPQRMTSQEKGRKGWRGGEWEGVEGLMKTAVDEGNL